MAISTVQLFAACVLIPTLGQDSAEMTGSRSTRVSFRRLVVVKWKADLFAAGSTQAERPKALSTINKDKRPHTSYHSNHPYNRPRQQSLLTLISGPRYIVKSAV